MEENIQSDVKDNDGTSEETLKSERVKGLNGRKLKKIRKQMEFYFSDANLQKDKFLKKLVVQEENGFVDLSVFLEFNKIRAITADVKDIIKALSWSNQLEVDKEKTKVHRKVPFVFKTEASNEETLYVENLPPHADHRYLKNLFQRFGKVAYVSLPHFRGSNKNKGFAFIEFESKESVAKACESCKYVSEEETDDNAESPSKPVGKKRKESISQRNARKRKYSGTAEKKVKVEGTAKEQLNHKKAITKESHGKIPIASSSTLSKSEQTKCSKKRKRQSSESSCPTKKTKTHDAKIDIKQEESHKETSVESSEEIKLEVETSPVKEKLLEELPQITNSEPADNHQEDGLLVEADVSKVCPHRKRRHRKVLECDKLKLRVLTIAEWRNFRNRYLSFQRKAMSKVKKSLLLERTRESNQDLYINKDEEARATEEEGAQIAKDEKQVQAAEEEEQAQATEEGQAEHVPSDEISENTAKTKSNKPAITFQEGVIVKINVTQGLNVLPQEMKTKVKSGIDDVAFVDCTALPNSEIFLRFNAAESASKACESEELKKYGSAQVISGEEETKYWEKLERDRFAQRNRQRPNKRGRDRIVAKANKKMEERLARKHKEANSSHYMFFMS